MPTNKNIILVGPMGAGKSAVGRQLANSLKRNFHDSDHEIVARTGVDINFIFEKEGEEGFRKRETDILNELCAKENIVLSTGGGSIVRETNREIINRSGIVIYLHASVGQQVLRTRKKDNRPLLHQGDPKKILEQLMQARECHYREVADLVVDTDEQKVKSVVDHILAAIESMSEQQENSQPKTLHELNVKTRSRTYPVHIGIDILNSEKVIPQLEKQNLVIVTDENLDKLYRKQLESKFKPLAWLVIPASESSKSMQHYQWLLDELLSLGVKRDAILLGFGGGVVGDLSGFVAATFMRGMQLMHMPSSLLAMVDSSIGGKTGINVASGKNLVGSIYQPHMVLTNLNFLKTLPQREYTSGLAEVIKYALLYDEKLMTKLEQQSVEIIKRDLGVMQEIVQRCIEIKAEIVAADEQDHGQRMLLNFGHTFAHAIETLQAYQGYKHGEAVAIGMCMAADLSHSMNKISAQDVQRVKNLIKSFGLPTHWSEFESGEFMQIMHGDKKNTATTQRFILLSKLGQAYVEESASEGQVRSILKRYQNSSSQSHPI